ncbi:hypothetical protein [Actinacidiphila rubida]|uniref:Uncharacterized protein n=1 Tax=Actinacidiphila rubida TaxID=310780 RepID=A0A1H8QVL4_9ACTN|nr:hypothetical protein [Actinacidiphila rubida]SEO57968.1 hypothetical protein SAMN05216267_103174 [Actinacidiphila rubida]
MVETSGLAPDGASRLSALADECGALLEGESGMDDVQQLLSARGIGPMDAIIVTRALLGAGEGSLREAKEIVFSASSRAVERQIHDELVHDLLHGVDEIGDTPDESREPGAADMG